MAGRMELYTKNSAVIDNRVNEIRTLALKIDGVQKPFDTRLDSAESRLAESDNAMLGWNDVQKSVQELKRPSVG